MENKLVDKENILSLDQSARDFLKQAAKSAYILSILVFIGVSLLLLLFIVVLFLGIGGDALRPFIMYLGDSPIICLVLMLLTFFPTYYLYKFAFHVKKALKENDNEALVCCFKYLKAHFRFILIFIFVVPVFILVLALPLLGLLFSGFTNYH